MINMQTQATTKLTPLPRWLTQWVLRRRIIYFIVACTGYLASVLTAGQLTPLRFSLITAIYGAWLGIFALGEHRGGQRPLWWACALFCLACTSPFIFLSGTNLNWLAILPTATACLIVARIPLNFSLFAAGGLWLSCSIVFTLTMHNFDFNAQLVVLISFCSFVGFTLVTRELTAAHTALTRSNAELATAHAQLQEYSAQAEEMAAIRERNRIAREIHDTLGHSLTILAVQLETATQYEMRGDAGLHEELLEARRVAKACLTDVRHSVEELRPDDAMAGSLQDRLRRLAAEFAVTCRETAITLDLDEAMHPLSPELTMTLYRCAQEALTNIRKHAHATKVLLYLSTGATSDGQAELTVLDNGNGPAACDNEQTAGFGLRGMRERVALLQGTMRAGPEPGHGWRVEVILPLKQREEAELAILAAGAEGKRW